MLVLLALVIGATLSSSFTKEPPQNSFSIGVLNRGSKGSEIESGGSGDWNGKEKESYFASLHLKSSIYGHFGCRYQTTLALAGPLI